MSGPNETKRDPAKAAEVLAWYSSFSKKLMWSSFASTVVFYAIARNSDPEYLLLWTIIYWLSFAAFFVGCYNFARSKGRSGMYALVSLLMIFGILWLYSLEDRAKNSVETPPSE